MTDIKFHTFQKDISSIALPDLFTWPFRYTPHPLSVLAADQLCRYLSENTEYADEVGKGKMFGVLVVEDRGQTGFLASYSGNLLHTSFHPYFVPPVVDLLSPDTFFAKEERYISELNRKISVIRSSEKYNTLKKDLEQVEKEAEEALSAMDSDLKQAKRKRDALRKGFQAQGLAVPPEKEEELQQESRFMKAEYRRERKKWEVRTAACREGLQAMEAEVAAFREERRLRSEALQQKVFNEFIMYNAKGETASIAEIFDREDHKIPPAGTGECASPKLLQYAYIKGMKPIAMAEFWLGASPKDVIRRSGSYYPACSGKCGPLLRFMLQGLPLETDPLAKGADASSASVPEIRELYEDRRILAVSKPAGMLSVPGKTKARSLVQLIRERHPEISGPAAVHRLDMDTSGILLIAKDINTYRILQKEFMEGRVVKRYAALLEGEIPEFNPETVHHISLPLAPDLTNRPCQLVSRSYGRPAETEYRIIDSRNGSTLVEMRPLTGRTHQLRVHAAHPEGLGMPIVGDPLYGTPGKRMYLHAEYLEFTHPETGERIKIEDAPDFGIPDHMESKKILQKSSLEASLPIKFRKAGLADIYLIRALAEICFRDTYREILTPEQIQWMMEMMYSRRSLHDQIIGGHTFYLLYYSANPCGYISIEQTGEADFCFQKIYLIPDCQGRGLGRKLIEKGMEHVCSSPCPCGRITLHVNRHNKARDFYLKMGFRILEEGDFDIGGGFFMNDYIMVKDFVTGGMEL